MMKEKLPHLYEIIKKALSDYDEYIEIPLRTSKDLEITQNNEAVLIELYRRLKEIFVYGEAKAAWYLAQFYYNGWLFEKDCTIGNFIIAIGIKLGSIKCANNGFKGDISKDLKNLAKDCAKTIKNTKNQYQLDINSIITDEIKKNAESNFKRNLENTELKNIFEPKFFPTSLDILQEALLYYSQNIKLPLTQSKDSTLTVTQDNKYIISKIYVKLKEALVCGQENAAWYLAQFYYNGWLVEKNIIYGDFILAIGKHFESKKCSNSDYKGEDILADCFQKLVTVCANSISNNKYVYRTGINDIMKLNAEKAINIHLNNTDLKDIFNSSESTIIPTISAPLPSTTHQPSNTVRRATQSDIKDFKNKKTTGVKKNKKYNRL
ncbi:hypothetical protein [Rickettsia bellii]|nr:hypothetical protein [Rickettsia bellii]ABV79341.1 hypothetical protein A1I_05040 [Rickettsia bellii OSU 85-389]